MMHFLKFQFIFTMKKKINIITIKFLYAVIQVLLINAPNIFNIFKTSLILFNALSVQMITLVLFMAVGRNAIAKILMLLFTIIEIANYFNMIIIKIIILANYVKKAFI